MNLNVIDSNLCCQHCVDLLKFEKKAPVAIVSNTFAE